jgi:hypothetical protein
MVERCRYEVGRRGVAVAPVVPSVTSASLWSAPVTRASVMTFVVTGT